MGRNVTGLLEMGKPGDAPAEDEHGANADPENTDVALAPARKRGDRRRSRRPAALETFPPDRASGRAEGGPARFFFHEETYL